MILPSYDDVPDFQEYAEQHKLQTASYDGPEAKELCILTVTSGAHVLLQ